jgi:hypothetical protein
MSNTLSSVQAYDASVEDVPVYVVEGCDSRLVRVAIGFSFRSRPPSWLLKKVKQS